MFGLSFFFRITAQADSRLCLEEVQKNASARTGIDANVGLADFLNGMKAGVGNKLDLKF